MLAKSPSHPARGGFTLVELSIVLVILGLLVGGVLSGQSLIRAAELSSVTTQLDGYRMAMNGFRDKYFAVPGDMTNATRFWGAASSGSLASCLSAQTIGSKATCNGDGDGYISTADRSGATAAPLRYSERFAAWKHLANAGLIEGAYSGVSATAADGYGAVPGENMPRARISNGVFDIYVLAQGSTQFFPESVASTSNIISLYGTRLKPEEMWNLDTKLDDGSPVTGSVISSRRSSDPANICLTTDDPATAAYDVIGQTRTCVIVFKI